jgi:hypothetical protein
MAEQKEVLEIAEDVKRRVKGLVDVPTMSAIQALRSSPIMDSLLAFQNTPAMRAVLAFQNSPAMSAMHSLQSSPVMRSILALQSLPSMRLAQLLPKSFQFSEHLQQLGSFANSIDNFRQAAQAFESTQASPLAEFFASERSEDIPDLVAASGNATISVGISGDFRVATPAELEIERQIVGHFEQGKPVSTLTGEQKFRLQLVIRWLILIMAFLQIESAVRQELCFFQPKLTPGMTSGQVGKAVRKYMCERDIPVEMLSRIRTVKGDGVRLRSGPGMKEEVLPVILQDRMLIEVLDSENRDWLHFNKNTLSFLAKLLRESLLKRSRSKQLQLLQAHGSYLHSYHSACLPAPLAI